MHARLISGETVGMSAMLSHLFLLTSLHASSARNGSGTASTLMYRFNRTPSFSIDRATSWTCFGDMPRPPLLNCRSPNLEVRSRMMSPFLCESALSRLSLIPGGFKCWLSAIVTTCTDGKSGVCTVAATVSLQHKYVSTNSM